MSADTLTVTSRAFYERTKVKIAASIVFGASALMLLGFCSYSAGEAQAAKLYAEDAATNAWEDINQAKADGYAFASFVYILAFILSLVAAIYVSPLICGTANEKSIVKNPQELEHTTPSPSAPSQV